MRFQVCSKPNFNEDDYPMYKGDYDGEKESIWYKCYDYYVEEEIIDNVSVVSIINLGEPHNILSACKILIEDILKRHVVLITADNNNRSQILIKRLIKDFNVYEEGEETDENYHWWVLTQ